jgi:hypothetical protein
VVDLELEQTFLSETEVKSVFQDVDYLIIDEKKILFRTLPYEVYSEVNNIN